MILPLRTFKADWSGGIQTKHACTTDIVLSAGGCEARRSLVDRPVRTHTFRLAGTTDFDLAGIFFTVQQGGTDQTWVPLYSDYAVVDAVVPAGAQAISVKTTADRRFYEGRKVLLCRAKPGSRSEWLTELAELDAVDPDALGVADPITNQLNPGDRVYVLVQAEVAQGGGTEPVTSRHGLAEVTVQEAVGYTQLPALIAAGTTDETVFGTYPVFPFRMDWRSVGLGVQTEGRFEQVGLGQLVQRYGPRPRAVLEASFTATTREQGLRLLRFFDSRAGRCFAFWLPTPLELGQVIAVAGTSVTIKRDTRPNDQWNDLTGRHVSFRTASGSETVRRVVSVNTGGTDITLTLASPLSLTPAQIATTHLCILARFNTDSLTENWSNDAVMQTELSVIELFVKGGTDLELRPDDVTVDSPLGTDPSLDPWEPLPPCDLGVEVPAWVVPCESCDPRRNSIQGANLRLPKVLTIRVKPEVFKDQDWPGTIAGNAALTELMDALVGRHNLTLLEGRNCIQSLAFIGGTNGQTFRLQWGAHFTGFIAYSTTPATLRANVEAALETMISAVLGGSNHLTVTGDGTETDPLLVEFTGPLVTKTAQNQFVFVGPGGNYAGACVVATVQSGFADPNNGSTGRHWHHLRLTAGPGGTSPAWVCPGDTPVAVTRKVYQRVLNYRVGGTTYQLDLRAVVEWTNGSVGARGYLLNIYAFSNQLNATYIEGASYTWPGKPATTFTRNDPCVLKFQSGNFPRMVHPQLVLAMNIPTTANSPCGGEFFTPDLSAEEIEGEDGPYGSTWTDGRREPCSARPCGLPWTAIDNPVELWSFANVRGVSLVGSAAITGPTLTLTPSLASRTGAMWWPKALNVADLDTTFTFRVTEVNGGGADGLAFVIQNQGLGAMGAGGGAMGYGENPVFPVRPGITRAIAVEIDLWDNTGSWNDNRSPQHLSVQVRNPGNDETSPDHLYSLASTSITGVGDMSNGQPHTVRIKITSNNRMRVWVNGALHLDFTLPGATTFTSYLNQPVLSGNRAFIGFTAATGGITAAQRHEILSWFVDGPNTPNPSISATFGNTMFGWDENNGYDASMMTLGAGCPTSEFFDYVCVENQAGLTPVRVTQPGWDSKQCGLTWQQSVTITACRPDPATQGCCSEPSNMSGTIRCLKVRGGTGVQTCCVSTTEPIEVDLGSVVQKEVTTYGAVADVPTSVVTSFFEVRRRLLFYPTTCSYYLWPGGPPGVTFMRWEYRERDPDYVPQSKSIGPFNESNFLSGMIPWLGACSYQPVPPAFKVTTLGSSANLNLALRYVDTSDGVVDGRIEAVVAQSPPTVPHVLAARGTYFAVFDPAAQTLEVWRVFNDPDSGSMVAEVLGARGGMSLSAGDTLSLTVVGSKIIAAINDHLETPDLDVFNVNVDNCVQAGAGFWGVGGREQIGAAFSSVNFLDWTYPVITGYVTLDYTGWSITVPKKMMPGYGGEFDNICTGCCTSPRTNCTRERYALHPPLGINSNQANTNLDYMVTPPGTQVLNPDPCNLPGNKAKFPYNMDNINLGTRGPLLGDNLLFMGYLARVRLPASVACPSNVDGKCGGFDVVYPICQQP